MKLFAEAYTETIAALSATDFSADQQWNGVLKGLRALVKPDGFAKGQRASLDSLRKRPQRHHRAVRP